MLRECLKFTTVEPEPITTQVCNCKVAINKFLRYRANKRLALLNMCEFFLHPEPGNDFADLSLIRKTALNRVNLTFESCDPFCAVPSLTPRLRLLLRIPKPPCPAKERCTLISSTAITCESSHTACVHTRFQPKT